MSTVSAPEPSPRAARPRATRQKAAVDRALDRIPDFVSAQELHARLQDQGERVSLATVYRTLQQQLDDGLVDMLRRDDGESVYRRCEDEGHHHHHGEFNEHVFYSIDTALKVSQLAEASDYPLTCIGVPKTIDNDLAVTDCSPGFGSAAKYTAVSVREAALDVASMAGSSTRVFVYEAMGRHAGWLAAAAGLAGDGPDDAPHLILFPERAYDEADFLARVQAVVDRVGWCVVVASEGIRTADGRFVAESGGGSDAFGHAQLGGVAPYLAGRVQDALGLKVHWAVPDYLQRSARHIASKTDLDQAIAVGRAAVRYALEGRNATMPAVRRVSASPYRWTIEPAPLTRVANREKKMPGAFLRRDGYGITAAARRYLQPLVRGEAWPPYRDGLPAYVSLKNMPVAKKLPDWEP